jgi:hypothetical protein
LLLLLLLLLLLGIRFCRRRALNQKLCKPDHHAREEQLPTKAKSKSVLKSGTCRVCWSPNPLISPPSVTLEGH